MQESFKISKSFWQALSPTQTILTGFVALAVAGALLLWLPISSATGARQSLLDALFVTSSAVSTTGLSVVDIGSAYSIFGQVVVLLLFQIGGLGYMTFLAFFALAFRRKLSYRSGQTVQESLSAPSRGELLRHVKRVVLFTAVFELLGAILLSLYWLRSYPLPQAVYLGIFHSVSAFCTAGFSLFTDNLAGYQNDLALNLILTLLSIFGAIGFLVLSDVQLYADRVIRGIRPRRLTIHSKVSLLLFAFLSLAGMAVIFLAARLPPDLSIGERLLVSFFQSFSAATTTGFNTVDIGQYRMTVLLTLMVLMFIGAPAGGTGGGIKITTFAAVLLFIRSLLTGEWDVHIFRRRIPWPTIRRAVAITFMAASWVILVSGMLTFTEKDPFRDVLFEVVSALGTVGLSTGITPGLSVFGKIAIMVTMVAGRVGLISVALLLMKKAQPSAHRYPKEEIFVG